MSSNNKDNEMQNKIENSQDTAGGGIRIMIYVLLLILSAAAIWYLFGGQAPANGGH